MSERPRGNPLKFPAGLETKPVRPVSSSNGDRARQPAARPAAPQPATAEYAAPAEATRGAIEAVPPKTAPLLAERVKSLKLQHDRVPTAAARLAKALDNSQTHSIHALVEPEYYKEQAETNKYILVAGWVVAGFMALGAVFGVMNTMFAAINQRIKDIGVLRILGFSKSQILGSFLLESLLIAALGGAIGCGLCLLLNLITSVPFVVGAGRAVAFAFRVDARTMLIGLTFSIIMGLVGGFVPALSAVRGRLLDILR